MGSKDWSINKVGAHYSARWRLDGERLCAAIAKRPRRVAAEWTMNAYHLSSRVVADLHFEWVCRLQAHASAEVRYCI